VPPGLPPTLPSPKDHGWDLVPTCQSFVLSGSQKAIWEAALTHLISINSAVTERNLSKAISGQGVRLSGRACV
jgi:hypothetical protein